MITHGENILTGKKVLLFPMADIDLEHFIKLHREDKHGYMQRYCLKEMTPEEARKYILILVASSQIYVWTVMTKEGKASRRAGYVYISDLSKNACNVSGIMDNEFAKGLGRILRRDKLTYAQDSLHTLLKFIFEDFGLERVETTIVENNRTALSLAQREGFKKEGVMRHYLKVDDSFADVAVLSILKNEWQFKMPPKQEAKEEIKTEIFCDGKI
jgi:RimJ/RimL family protein N-acetyltransferase